MIACVSVAVIVACIAFAFERVVSAVLKLRGK